MCTTHQPGNYSFFKYKFIYFNWRLITLQYCMILPYIDMNLPWVYTCSPSCTPLPPPSPYHSSESSQCTSPEHPVSCIKPGLVIHFTYDIIHVSMLFSQIIPLSPSPTESKISITSQTIIQEPATFQILFETFLDHLSPPGGFSPLSP